MNLILKRVVLLSLLILSIGALSVYAYYNQDEEPVSIYMNLRDQSDDYDNLFDSTIYKEFTIEFEEDVFDAMIANMQEHFDEYGNYVDNTMYPVNMIYSDSSGSFEVFKVGFRTKSTTSRNLLRTIDWRGREVFHQTTFQLQFNETFDYADNTNIREVLKTREVFNLEQLNFEYSQIFNSSYDQAMISESYTHYLYEQAGLDVAKASNAVVYLKIGDQVIPYGLFTVIEPIDSEFVKSHFRSDLALQYGDLFKVTDVQTEGSLTLNYDDYIGINTDNIRYTYALRNNTLDNTRRTFEEFESFVEQVNDFDYFEDHYEDVINIDSFIRYLAIDFLVGNSDDLRYNYNNYYLYFDVYSNQVTFIPFDLDNALGFGKNIDLSGDYMVDYSVLFNLDKPSPLVEHIFMIPELVDLYEQYLLEFVEDFFTYDDFLTTYNITKDLYEDILVSEDHLGNQVFSTRNLEWYFTQKIEHVLNELQ